VTKRVASPARPHEHKKRQERVLTRDPTWARDAIRTLRKQCHPKQLDTADDPSRFVAVLVARGGGKTVGSEVRLVETMCRKKAKCLFVTDTREHAADICWEPLKALFTNLGIEIKHSEVKKTITLVKNGSTLRLGGADDRREVNKYRGVPYDGVVVDEAAFWDPEILEWFIDRGVGPRQGEVDGWIMMTSSPGHNLAGPFYEATRPGGTEHRPYTERNDPQYAGWDLWSSHTWTLEYGARFVEKIAKNWEAALRKKKAKGWLDTNPVWMREHLGLWAADHRTMVFAFQPHDEHGKPKNEWDPKRVGPLQVAALPTTLDGAPVAAADWHHVFIFDKGAGRRDLDEDNQPRRKAGTAEKGDAEKADEGKGDPFAVNVFAFTPRDPQRRIWHRYSFEAVKGMTARALACLLFGARDDDPLMPYDFTKGRGLMGATGGWPDAIVGDCDQGFLDELALYGGAAVKADKSTSTKAFAIEEVNGDFDENRIFILKDSPLDKQLRGLQWKTDIHGILRENKAQANHSTDCLVYGRQAISRLFETGAVIPDAPGKKVRTVKPARPPPAAAPSADEDEDEDTPASAFLRGLDGFLATDTYDG
jgi:hypothetical protein